MTIHFFTFGDEQAGSSRQRGFRVAEKLRERGLETVIHKPNVVSMSRTSWPKKGTLILQTIRGLFSIKKGDIIFLQRAISNKYFFVIIVTYLFLSRRKMIFDFDDPVYVHSFLKTKIFTKMADAVIVCTHGQEKWARQYNKNVTVIHIALDLPLYQKFTRDYFVESTPQVIGWVGAGPEHLSHLKILASAFRKLLEETKIPFKFVLIGALKDKKLYNLFQQVRGLNVEFVDELEWNNPESAPREIQKFDIGVLPHQSEGAWNEDKTAFKQLEYMACGVATIVSEFGEMPHIIEDGINGFIVSSEEEWVLKLKNLLEDKKLRIELGSKGRERVREGYCFDVTIPKIAKIIESL